MHDLNGWVAIPCAQSDEVRTNKRPRSSLADPSGNYGMPVVYTEWAGPDDEQPVLRDYRWFDDRDCTHYIPEEK